MSALGPAEAVQYSHFCRTKAPVLAPANLESPSRKQGFKLFGFATKYGKMAAKLVCFYCGKKSNLRFDGQEQWTCATCEAVNYLDEVCFLCTLQSSTANNTDRMERSLILLSQFQQIRHPRPLALHRSLTNSFTPRSQRRIHSAEHVSRTNTSILRASSNTSSRPILPIPNIERASEHTTNTRRT